jgi:hypothetical protein
MGVLEPIDRCMYHCLRRLVECFFEESHEIRSSSRLNIDRDAWNALVAKAPRGHRPVCGFADGYDSDELAECPAVMQLLDSSDDEDPIEDQLAGMRRRTRAAKQGTVVMRNNLMRLLLSRDSRTFPDARWIADADRKIGIDDVGLTTKVVRQLLEGLSTGSRYDLVYAADADAAEVGEHHDS